jgi:tellurite resistance protein TerC
VSALAWVATIAVIAGLLGVDLAISSRRPHRVEFREAVAWSVFYVAAALIFGVVFGALSGWHLGAQYFAGYLVEKSLSVDNLFVFVIIFASFAVPTEHQQRLLTLGIVAALVLRGIFIALGAGLLSLFSVTFLIFGLLLLVTAVQLYRHRNQDPSIDDNVIVGLARRVLPVADRFDGGKLTTWVGGRRALTPMALALIAIGTTDVVFALDSIPAVYGITSEPFIVFAANAFALLGLRALFFLVSGLLDRLVYLSTGLAVILAFIGVKLVLHYLHEQDDSVPEISTWVSLGVIAVILTVSTIASVRKARRDPSARAHAGSLRGQSPPSDPPPSRSRP